MSTIPTTVTPTIGGHPDLSFKAALDKVPPRVQQKLKATAQDFEAVFLGTMFSQMTSGLKGEGPFGNSVGTGVWRSMLTDEYAKSFASAGGIGLSNDVFRAMIMQQAARTA
jgi:Rod binding domain-containing protein